MLHMKKYQKWRNMVLIKFINDISVFKSNWSLLKSYLTSHQYSTGLIQMLFLGFLSLNFFCCNSHSSCAKPVSMWKIMVLYYTYQTSLKCQRGISLTWTKLPSPGDPSNSKWDGHLAALLMISFDSPSFTDFTNLLYQRRSFRPYFL